jgi:hypothetical protein
MDGTQSVTLEWVDNRSVRIRLPRGSRKLAVSY